MDVYSKFYLKSFEYIHIKLLIKKKFYKKNYNSLFLANYAWTMEKLLKV